MNYNGHFEKGKWVEDPYYYPICRMKARKGDEGYWIFDIPPEKGDTVWHNGVWLVFDGRGWKYGKN